MLTLKDGEYLVRLARRAIECYLEGEEMSLPENLPGKFKEKAGVFVTLDTYPEGELRGCIGFPEPIYPLAEGVVKAAVAASVEDPRFPSMNKRDKEDVILKLSLLTPPKPLKVSSPREYPRMIEVGRHGLMVERSYARGLLLPQVPVEYGWGEEEFLAHTCLKAGLSSDCWLDNATRIYTFEGTLFKEEEPGGKVVRESMKGRAPP